MLPLGPVHLQQAALHACWKSIGVAGDKTCPELADHAHCRNCPTYSAAAMTLLDRPVAEGLRATSNGHDIGADAPERAKDRSAVTFRLGREWFALATSAIDEIIEPRPVHALPHQRSAAMLGITNVRGELVICLSLAALIGMAVEDAAGSGSTRRFLVVRSGTGPVAVPVDEVEHARRYHDGELKIPPATIARSDATFTAGLLTGGSGTAAKLDEARLFSAIDRTIA